MSKRSRKPTLDDYRSWEAEIESWDLLYQFGIAPPERQQRPRLSEILLLSIQSRLAYPRGWTGIGVRASIYGRREVERQAANDDGPYDARTGDISDPSEDVGHLWPVLKTRTPKELSLTSWLPADRVLAIVARLEARTFKALDIHTHGQSIGDPKAHRIGALAFKSALDPQE